MPETRSRLTASVVTDVSTLLSEVAPSGGGSDLVFYENDAVITTDYTITAGTNAGTFGPVTINSGATVTVPSGSVWTVI